MPESVRVSLYADDVAVWAQDRRKEVALAKVRNAVAAIARWSKPRCLQLSDSKCTLSLFSQDVGEAGWRPEVEVDGLQLRFEPNPVFLGVKFDRMLSFRKQAEDVATRASSRCRQLAALAGQDWGWRRTHLLKVFTALIRGTLDYCAAGWLAPVWTSLPERTAGGSVLYRDNAGRPRWRH